RRTGCPTAILHADGLLHAMVPGVLAEKQNLHVATERVLWVVSRRVNLSGSTVRLGARRASNDTHLRMRRRAWRGRGYTRLHGESAAVNARTACLGTLPARHARGRFPRRR